MKILGLVTFLLGASSLGAAEPDSWLREWPQGSTGQRLAPAQVVEMPHSLFPEAEQRLQDTALVAVGAEYRGRISLICPGGTSMYLVRALYEHGSNGTFEAYRSGDALLIRHYALGPKTALHRSALLVCLGFLPKEIYVATGGAL